MQSVSLTSPLVSETFFSNFALSVSYLVFKTNPLVSILVNLATNLPYAVVSTTLLLNALFTLLKSTGTVFSFLHLIHQIQL